MGTTQDLLLPERRTPRYRRSVSPPAGMFFTWEQPPTRETLELLAAQVRARTGLAVMLQVGDTRDDHTWATLAVAGDGLDDSYEVQANRDELIIVADAPQPHVYVWPHLAAAALALGATSRYRLPALPAWLARPWTALSRRDRFRAGPGRRIADGVLTVLSIPFWPYWIARSALGARGARR